MHQYQTRLHSAYMQVSGYKMRECGLHGHLV